MMIEQIGTTEINNVDPILIVELSDLMINLTLTKIKKNKN